MLRTGKTLFTYICFIIEGSCCVICGLKGASSLESATKTLTKVWLQGKEIKNSQYCNQHFTVIYLVTWSCQKNKKSIHATVVRIHTTVS